jgi:hypothetical protein
VGDGTYAETTIAIAIANTITIVSPARCYAEARF